MARFKGSNLWVSLTLPLLLSCFSSLPAAAQNKPTPPLKTQNSKLKTSPTVKPSNANDEVTPEDKEDGANPVPQNTDQLGDGEVNPLNPAGDSLDRLIKLRINDDLWKAMLGDLPCLETQEACIKTLQGLAVQNSRSLRAIDERIQIVNQKIEEARQNNQRTINLGVFEPLVTAYLKLDTVTTTNAQGQQQTRQRGFFDRVFNLFTGGSALLSGANEILSLIGVPLFRNLGGGDAAAQTRQIAITDLQVKVAQVEKERAEVADKIKEMVTAQVLEFDVVRKDFQVSQEIARREVIRGKLRQIDYRYSTKLSTDAYLSSLSSLDNVKANSYRQWARLRNQLAKIKLLVLGDNDG
ncbi:MAG: hypothetical protein NW224_12060 [Leptolyngbyaceae cyanobacterium bins.302]|nr:hypothetical protein [Leptolyngbyaceae cyanobacterium bins.302]